VAEKFNATLIDNIKRFYIGVLISNEDYSNPDFRNLFGLKAEVSCVKHARRKILDLLKLTHFNPENKDAELY